MAASFDACDGLVELERAMHTGARRGAPGPSGESIEALTARLIRAALVDSGLDARAGGVALLVLGDDRTQVARLAEGAAASQGLAGTAVGLPAGALAEALRRVDDLLDDAVIDAVVLAGVSDRPAEGPPSAPAARGTEPSSLGFDRVPQSYSACRGGAAVVLVATSAEGAAASAPRGVYATLAAAAWAPTVQRAAARSLAVASAAPEEIGYVEAWAAADPVNCDEESRGLAEAYGASAPGARTTAVGGARAVLGDIGAAAQAVVGLVRAALALRRRFVPGVPAWRGPRAIAKWRQSGLYVPEAARPWFAAFAAGSAGARLAAAQALDSGPAGPAFVHGVLREELRAPRVTPAFQAIAPIHLVPLAGTDAPALVAALAACEADLASGADPAQVAARAYAAARHGALRGPSGLAAALVGRDRAELIQEVAAARRGLPLALEKGADWNTPRGSCFAPRPLGRRGALAFMYPGAFTVYPGVLRDAFQVFPSLHAPRGAWPSDVGRAFAEHLLYPRGIEPLDLEGQAAFEAKLYASPGDMISAGTLCAVAHTRIVRETFGLEPAAAFGYSLGESTMCWALGVWTDGDAAAEELRNSDLFRSRLGGPRDALREFWLRRGRPDHAAKGAWSSHVLTAAPADVAAAIERSGAQDAFLVAIHSPTEVVVAGAPEACARVIATLGRDQVPMPFPLLLHSDVIATEYDRFATANRWPASRVDGIAFHSAAEPHGPFVPEGDGMARRIARMVTQPLDFAALVERVYAGGARIFLELGPNGGCSRLVAANLRGREHVAVSLDRRGVDTQTGILRALARLFAHRVEIDLSALYAASPDA
jgi:PfaB family protein